MPTAVWTGTLSFGLVSVPVRLFPATEPKDVRFHQYDRAGRRLRYRRVVEDDGTGGVEDDGTETEAAPATPEERPARAARPDATEGPDADAPNAPTPSGPVDWNDVVLGRETETGETVLVEREEIERIRPRRSSSIDIEDFVDLDDIDPVYFDKTYYAVPRSADEAKPYAVLLHAMQRAGRVGIGRFVLRTKPHLVAVRPADDVLAVQTLFFGDEVRDAARLSPVAMEAIDASERELALAEQLIGMLATDWDPAGYADTYREELLSLLATKAPLERGVAEPRTVEGPGGRIDELMAALKESVEVAKRARGSDAGESRTG